jgi:multidrug efflux pump subunit AcrB
MANREENVSAAGKTARYFTQHWHVSVVLLLATLAWGLWGYSQLPKAKDPFVPVRVAVATCAWPGTSAEKIEQLVTRKIEQKVAENATVEKIESLSLLVQFKNAIKPLVVFAAIPFGVGAALLSLGIMNTPFGFMAFLGIISLIGVIVSHIIVLFDFIEEQREHGAPLREALLNAGVIRLRWPCTAARCGTRCATRKSAV